jgi:hypothetical protein
MHIQTPGIASPKSVRSVVRWTQMSRQIGASSLGYKRPGAGDFIFLKTTPSKGFQPGIAHFQENG